MTVQEKISLAASRYGVPESIALAVAWQESRYRQSAVSSAGAIGVMQLMPATAAELGVDPYDEDQNIEGGVRYLAQMYSRFGSWDLALAAYNAGPGRVAKYGGIPPIAETQSYVASVLRRAEMSPSPRQDMLGSVLPGGDVLTVFLAAILTVLIVDVLAA